MKQCKDCIHYRWMEDVYDDGSYIHIEYCNDDTDRPCYYHQPACECFFDKEGE
jgi:hypothetical protein